MPTTIVELLNDPKHGLTTVDHESGPRIVASTLAAKLGYPRTARVLDPVLDDEKGQMVIQTPHGPREVYYLTLPGFLRAIGSRTAVRIPDLQLRAAVEEFQNWVYRDVLPKVITTGLYTTPQFQESIDLATLKLENGLRRAAIAKDKPALLKALAYLATEGAEALHLLGTKRDPNYDYNDDSEWPDELTEAIKGL